jgi:alpha-amylase
MLDLIRKHGGNFKIAYSISGTALDQFEMYMPELIDSFKALAETGCVEFLAETYSHSLSALRNKEEFVRQVKMHTARIEELFGQTPKVFRNTELIYSDYIGEVVASMGYKAMMTEGADHILGWKSPNYVYFHPQNPKLKLLLKNYKLSDDIAFRFSDRNWNEWPLTSEKYVSWLNELNSDEETVNLFMDYETFGEHQWHETGIFDFMRAMPDQVLQTGNFRFVTPSENIKLVSPVASLSMPNPVSWADQERDLSAWLGNDLQDDAFENLYKLASKVKACKDEKIEKDWLYLQTSDHFYYMCTKFFSDGDIHKYFSPFNNPYDAFINYMNVLTDFKLRVNKTLERKAAEKVVVPKVHILGAVKQASSN